MPFHDLNVTYSNDASLTQILTFLQELEYSVVALNVNVNGKLSARLPMVETSNLSISCSLKMLSRLTLTVADTSQNHRISSLNSAYDILALRPTNDKAFQLCCSSLDCDILSLDFTQRIPFPIKFKTVASALQRGIRFEICYSGGITGGNDARRNLISGAAALIRATRGRGIIVSSEAATALALRAPWDVVNLAAVWGISPERGKEAVCEESERVVRLAGLKRTSFRGVVDIVNDGTQETSVELEKKPHKIESTPSETLQGSKEEQRTDFTKAPSELKQVTVIPDKTKNQEKAKRKASTISLNDQKADPANSNNASLSKRELKRLAKKARLDRAAGLDNGYSEHANQPRNDRNKNRVNAMPIQRETVSMKKKKE